MVDLVGFEDAVYRRDTAQAIPRMLQIASGLATNKAVVDDSEVDGKRSSSAAIQTRVAAAMAALMTDPQVKLSTQAFERLAVLSRAVDNLFLNSAFESSDFALRALGKPTLPETAPSQDDLQRLVKFYCLFSIDSKLDVDVAEIFRAPPRIALLIYLNLMSAKPIVTEQGQARRERLLELAERLKVTDLPATVDHLVLLSNAWMLCSYAEHPRKHHVKRILNLVLRQWLEKQNQRDLPLPTQRIMIERPTLLVAAEIMHSNHVQYRYFGQWLRQLRTRFRLVCVTDKREVDDHVRGLYDEIFTFERNPKGTYLAEIVNFIRQTKPDMIFWLSVGMRHWGPTLANLRLAPIQFTAIGHSASTYCPYIDYYLIEEGYVGDPHLMSETVILLPDTSLRFERSPHYVPVPPVIRERPDPLRIVLPSNLLKLNPRFLKVLSRIRAAAKRPLEFHVFPNAGGLEGEAARNTIRKVLPGAMVHGVLPYNRYLEALNACDLNLSPYPFGGLHSVVDSLRQGIPVVALEGLEPHARTDAMLLRLLKMPEWLITHSEQEYVAASLKVIEDDALRIELSRQALALDIDRTLFGDGTTSLKTDVVDAAMWIYRNHEAVQRDGRKAWTAADRRALEVALIGTPAS